MIFDGWSRRAPPAGSRSRQLHLDYSQIWGPLLVLSIGAIWLTVHLVPPAPPHVLTMSAGPKGGAFETVAMNGTDVALVQ